MKLRKSGLCLLIGGALSSFWGWSNYRAKHEIPDAKMFPISFADIEGLIQAREDWLCASSYYEKAAITRMVWQQYKSFDDSIEDVPLRLWRDSILSLDSVPLPKLSIIGDPEKEVP